MAISQGEFFVRERIYKGPLFSFFTVLPEKHNMIVQRTVKGIRKCRIIVIVHPAAQEAV